MLTERANSGLHQHVEARIQVLGVPKDQPILDIGCGTGAFLSRLARLGYSNLQGVDIALPAQPVAGAQFYTTDLDSGDIPLASASMRLLVSVEVLEHIENAGAFFREAARLLQPEGLMLLTTPNIHSLEAKLRYVLNAKLKQFDELSDPTHIYPVALFALQRLLARHGLQIAQRWGYPENGSSPTSRRSLRLMTSVLRAMGMRGDPDGDHLCLLIKKLPAGTISTLQSKAEQVTSHY